MTGANREHKGPLLRHSIGIDVQVARGLACAILRTDGSSCAALWCEDPKSLFRQILSHLERDNGGLSTAVFAVDSPRRPLVVPREHYWDRAGRRWRPRRASEAGFGRHCEIVISAHGLARPQWTPLVPEAPDWMKLGFEVFACCGERSPVHEVFPSACYRQLEGTSLPVQVDLGACSRGPKDMLDAHVCAACAIEYEAGRGSAIGGGDGLGTIVLPRPLDQPIREVLDWPDT